MKLIGITGTHGTGKTTLAKYAAETMGYVLSKTDVSGVFLKHGEDPRNRMTLLKRIEVQNDILNTLTEQWRNDRKYGENVTCVTDRTPYCFISFMLAEISGYDKLTAVENRLVVEYIQRCEEVAAEFFDLIVYLPMAIPFVPAVNKIQAVNGQAYREHYDRLLLGSLHSCASSYTMQSVELDKRSTELSLIAATI